MEKQSRAEDLAQSLEVFAEDREDWCMARVTTLEKAAAELRRLHAENERLKSIARELFEADEAYGCGFYNDDRWRAAYNALRRNI